MRCLERFLAGCPVIMINLALASVKTVLQESDLVHPITRSLAGVIDHDIGVGIINCPKRTMTETGWRTCNPPRALNRRLLMGVR